MLADFIGEKFALGVVVVYGSYKLVIALVSAARYYCSVFLQKMAALENFIAFCWQTGSFGGLQL